MKYKNIVTSATALLITHSVTGAELSITIQNLTGGIYFTPLLISAHDGDSAFFVPGIEASVELQAMAEGGDIAPLESLADSIQANSVANPAAGLLGPTATTTFTLTTTESNDYLSVVAMMLPTNDGFIGLNSWPIPSVAGEYHLYLNAYDAGTEANDEIRGSGMPGQPGMPVPPPLESLVGTGGEGMTSDIPNNRVHIHPGNIGDADSEAGRSDVSNSAHRWLNPVASIHVVVSE